MAYVPSDVATSFGILLGGFLGWLYTYMVLGPYKKFVDHQGLRAKYVLWRDDNKRRGV